MLALRLNLEGDGAWPDLIGRTVFEGQELEITGLAGGLTSGKPSVAIRIDLPHEMVAIAQTSLALFLTAADALKAKYGDPRK